MRKGKLWKSSLQTKNDGQIKVQVTEMEKFLNFFGREKIKVVHRY
jgi:hypothetical protein